MPKSSLLTNKSKFVTLGDHLAFLIKNAKQTIHELSNNTGVPVSTIHRLLNDPSCNPTMGSLLPIAKFFRMSVSELLMEDHAATAHDGWYSADTSKWHPVPLVNIKEFSNITELKEKLAFTSTTETIKTDINVSPESFAIKMYDQSMTPMFPQGTSLIFDPLQEPIDRAYVLVFIKKEATFVFKQIYFDGSKQYLRSINDHLENVSTVRITSNDKIIGTLIQSIVSF